MLRVISKAQLKSVSLAIPLARRLVPGQATTQVEQQRRSGEPERLPTLYLLRKWMLARERRAVIRRAHRASRRGELVLCDRFPGEKRGAVDGPSYLPEQVRGEGSRLRRWLMERELAAYAGLPAPDLVFELSVSLDVALQRHRERAPDGGKDEDYVRARHGSLIRPEFPRSRCIAIDTGQSLEDCLAQIRSSWPPKPGS